MNVRSLSVQLPFQSVDFSQKISLFSKRIGYFISKSRTQVTHLLHSFISMINERKTLRENGDTQASSFERRQKLPGFKSSKSVKWIALTLIIIVVLFGLGKIIKELKKNSSSPAPNVDVKAPLASVDINREFSFPLKAAKGEKVADVKYMVEKAELRDEILVKGSRATAVKGREFLVLTIKITNDYKSPIQMNTRDYVRLSVNGNENEWLAPDIHNDPVEVQAISTKYTRVGFAIDVTDKNLVLSVGEINGDKEKLPLEFK